MTSTTAITIFRLFASLQAWEAPLDLGTYASRELAERAKTELLPLWPGMTEDDVYIDEEPLRTTRPEVHRFQACIPLFAPHTPDVFPMSPRLRPCPPMTHLLADPVRFVRNPLSEAIGSGETPELAVERAQACLKDLLARGADDILRKSRSICERAEALVAERERAAGESGLGTLERLDLLCRLEEELATAEFG